MTSLPSSQVCFLLLCFLCLSSSSARPPATSPRDLFSHPKSTPSPPPSPTPSMPTRDRLEEIVHDAERLISHHSDSYAALRRFRLAGLLGHPGALYTAATLLLNGDSQLPRDVPSALRHLRLAATRGHSGSRALLGALHASGITDRHGVPKSMTEAIRYWTLASHSNNPYSATALGFRHLYGIGVNKSCPLAADYYKRAAHSVATDDRFSPSAINFVDGKPPLPSGLMETPPSRLDESTLAGKKFDSADRDLVQYFRHWAEHGNAADRTTLGALYFFGGHGIDPDEGIARVHLQRAAEAGNHEAHAILGHLDMRARRNESARTHFMMAVGPNNNKLAHYALGMAYRHGLLGVEQSSSKAAMHFQLALDVGQRHAGASFELGMMYWYGDGVDENRTEAFRHFEQAAKDGNIQSKLNVGAHLVDGSSDMREVDCERGVQLLKEVAEDGAWRTVLDLASEKVDKGDYFGALLRYMEAAHAGIELGQYNAAFLLEKMANGELGELVHWDRNRMLMEAKELYELSALQGHPDSLIRIAHVIYDELKDYGLVAKTFERAAELKSAEGMVSLALMHARGLGVEENRNRALDYLISASTTTEEAILPVKVALMGLPVYWFARDLLRFVWASYEWLVESDVNKGVMDKLGKSGDVALVCALFVALATVLLVRSKRLARQ